MRKRRRRAPNCPPQADAARTGGVPARGPGLDTKSPTPSRPPTPSLRPRPWARPRHETTNMPMNDLRSSMRKARRELGARQREEAAVRCAERALEIAEVRRARSIAFYMAHRGEVSCAPLMDWALARGIRALLPVVVGRHMRFAPYSPGAPAGPEPLGHPRAGVAAAPVDRREASRRRFRTAGGVRRRGEPARPGRRLLRSRIRLPPQPDRALAPPAAGRPRLRFSAGGRTAREADGRAAGHRHYRDGNARLSRALAGA